MDGLFRLVGTGATITLGGELLTVQGRTLRHYGELEGHFLRLRGNPFDRARLIAKAIPNNPQLAKNICTEIVRQTRTEFYCGTLRDLAMWRNTWEGRPFALWQAVRHNPGWGYKRVYEAFWSDIECQYESGGYEAAEKWWVEVVGAIDQASGEDEVSLLDFIHTPDKEKEDTIFADVLRSIVEAYHLELSKVLDYTFPQIFMLVCDKGKLHDDRSQEKSATHMKTWRRRFDENYRKAADNLCNGTRWDVSVGG